MKLKAEDILKPGAKLIPRKLTPKEIEIAKGKASENKLPRSIRWPFGII